MYMLQGSVVSLEPAREIREIPRLRQLRVFQHSAPEDARRAEVQPRPGRALETSETSSAADDGTSFVEVTVTQFGRGASCFSSAGCRHACVFSHKNT